MDSTEKLFGDSDNAQEKRFIRVQFDFSIESYELFKGIQTYIGASTPAEVLRRALSLYHFLSDLQKKKEVLVLPQMK